MFDHFEAKKSKNSRLRLVYSNEAAIFITQSAVLIGLVLSNEIVSSLVRAI